ncbi:MAG: histidine phosphatase family protein, partial [Betaproteobacteria bacterium]|nr:histidine phosphatase family protein [Betaproteobacteria bacterium]
GQRQSQRLGEYLRERFTREGVQIDTVLMGSLRRHRETWQAMADGAGWTLTPSVWPELNEYDSHALIAAIHPEPLPKPDTPELYRHHFRLLRDALRAWMDGHSQPQGMPSHAQFVQGIEDVLAHVRQQGSRHVLIVSSGGPISTAVGRVLGTPAQTTIELNLRIRNTALSELAFTLKRHMLLTYNSVPHLDSAAHQDWVTYA